MTCNFVSKRGRNKRVSGLDVTVTQTKLKQGKGQQAHVDGGDVC